MLVKCSWLVWRHVSSRPRDSSETFRIHRETRWGSRPKFRSQILDSWRKVPIVFREPLKHELDRLSNIGVIQKVDKPTSWISALVVTTKKNGKARLCIDPKPLNGALHRNYYPLPTIDDVLPLLSKAPKLADLAKPLRELVKEDNEFVWDKEVHGQCLDQLKQVLTQAPVLKFFDPPKEDRTSAGRLYEWSWSLFNARWASCLQGSDAYED